MDHTEKGQFGYPASKSLHHAASFNTEAKGGRMVKEWDFEAGIFVKKSKRIKYPTMFYVLWPLLVFFSVIHGVSLHKTG